VSGAMEWTGRTRATLLRKLFHIITSFELRSSCHYFVYKNIWSDTNTL